MLKNVLNWIEQRTGVISAHEYFLEEDIPASAGWHQVFGSVVPVRVPVAGGDRMLMAVNYAPDSGGGLGELALRGDAGDGGSHHPRAASLGRQRDDRGGGSAHDADVSMGGV